MRTTKKALAKASIVLALATIAASVLAPMAQAHTPQITVTCDQISLHLVNYNGENHVDYKIGTEMGTDYFGTSYDRTWIVPGGTGYWIRVFAHDDPDFNKGWSVRYEGETPPCDVTTTSMPSSTTTTGPSSTTTMPPEPTTTTIPSEQSTTTQSPPTTLPDSSTTTTGPNGSSSSVVPPTSGPTLPPSLPYTGADTAILLMVGVGLLGLGSLALGWRKDTE